MLLAKCSKSPRFRSRTASRYAKVQWQRASCRQRETDTLPLPAVTSPVVSEMSELWAALDLTNCCLLCKAEARKYVKSSLLTLLLLHGSKSLQEVALMVIQCWCKHLHLSRHSLLSISIIFCLRKECLYTFLIRAVYNLCTSQGMFHLKCQGLCFSLGWFLGKVSIKCY